jgi:hypothetical protein
VAGSATQAPRTSPNRSSSGAAVPPAAAVVAGAAVAPAMQQLPPLEAFASEWSHGVVVVSVRSN